MYERRPGGYPRRAGAKIYYPSGKSPEERRSRFRRRDSNPEGRRRSPIFSFGENLLKKRFRPHSDRNVKKAAGKRFRAHVSDRHKQDEAARRTVEPVVEKTHSERPAFYPAAHAPAYPYYPVPPVIPPPPPYPYGPYDRYGRRMSEKEIAELDARENYEDRYGRDFDHYADSPSCAPSLAEALPKNYLVDPEDGQ